MIRGQAGQIIGAQLYDTNNNPFTGSAVVYIDGDHTGQVLGSVGGGVCFNRGNGYYDYITGAQDVAYTHIAFTFVPTGGLNATIQVETLSPAQIQALQTASGLGSTLVSQIIKDAVIEIGVGRAADTFEPGLMDWGLGKMRRILDRWNATPGAKYAQVFTSYTPTIAHNPHTLGPSSADWSVTQRPAKILGANLVLNTVSPAVRVPINVRDEYWWLNTAVQGLSSSMVTDLYYDPRWPNGNVNLYPIPTATYPIELLTDLLFDVVALTDVIWFPFAYRDALTLTLAEAMAPGLGQSVSKSLHDQATDARVTAFGQNTRSRNIRTRDAGMPGGRRGGSYLYRTGRMKGDS